MTAISSPTERGASLNTRLSRLNRSVAAQQVRRSELTWWLWFAALIGLTLFSGWWLTRAGVNGPDPILFAWIAYLIGAALILYQPRFGIYLVLFFALAGDARLMPSYPFTKNFSSAESLLYINDTVIFSPAELYLGLAFFSWFVRGRLRRKLDFHAGDLFGPAMLFLGFLIYGLVYGLGLRGGDVNIGLWEARPIFYLPLMLILAGNLLRTKAHINRMFWAAMLGLLVKSIVGNIHFFFTLHGDLTGVDRITEHAAAIQMNTLFLLAIGVWLYNGSRAKRVVLPLLIPLVLIPYLATQRRAAIITLAIALALTAVFLYQERRRLFWVLVPAAVLAGLACMVVFWNSNSAIAFPVQAVKSVISSRIASEADWASNFYRILENANISFTIHQAPLRGVGFGNPFYVGVTMPDISFFEWWQYITHNSILWMWMKTGVGGFIAMLVLIMTALSVGLRALGRMPRGDLRAFAMVGTLYIVVHFTYAYVDMSWDNQSMLYMGALMGMLNGMERIVEEPESGPRWKWRSPRRIVAKPKGKAV